MTLMIRAVLCIPAWNSSDVRVALNHYAYAKNNPVMGSDPSALCAKIVETESPRVPRRLDYLENMRFRATPFPNIPVLRIFPAPVLTSRHN